VAVIASLVSLAHQAYNPPVHVLGRKRGTTAFRARTTEHPDDETWPGLLILRPEGRLFFANADRVVDRISPIVSHEQPRVVLLDCRGVTDIEYTALRMLIDAEERLRSAGVTLWLAGLNPQVLEVVRRSALGDRLGRARMFFNLDAAVHAYEQSHVA
jgi:SulP family sulfate permease